MDDSLIITPGSEDDYAIHPYSSAPDEELKWIWQDRIPLGMITAVNGYPSSGKSSLAVDIIARGTRGDAMPDGIPLPEPINCIYQCTEAGKIGLVKRMLRNAGADLDRVYFIEGEYLTVSDPRLKRAMEESHASLLVIDPIQEFFDSDMNNAQSVRRELGALGRFAAEHECAVVLIGHFTKDNPARALYHGMGSSDIYAIARSVLHVIDQGEGSTLRYVKVVKSNNTKAGSMFWYEIIETGVVKWIGPEDPEDAEALEKEARKRLSPKHDLALKTLTEMLPYGQPVASLEVQKRMTELGISDSTYRRARKQLGIDPVRLGDGWYMRRG